MFREEILNNINTIKESISNSFFENNIKKAALPEGTIREWKGEKFQKVGGKWIPVKKEREKKEEDPKKVKTSEEHAKGTPTKDLQKFVKESKDEELKKVAEKELGSRKEEGVEKKGEVKKKEEAKKEEFKTFKDEKEMQKYFDTYNEQVGKLNDKQLDSLDTYRSVMYEDINGYLRGEDIDVDKKEVKALIKDVDSAFKGILLSKDTEVYRGVSGTEAKEFISFIDSLNEGDVYEDKGFVSTSLSKEAVDAFTGKISPYVFKIKMKKGQKAIPMQNIGNESDLETYNKEFEFLLNRNSKFKIVSKEKEKESFYHPRLDRDVEYEKQIITVELV